MHWASALILSFQVMILTARTLDTIMIDLISWGMARTLRSAQTSSSIRLETLYYAYSILRDIVWADILVFERY